MREEKKKHRGLKGVRKMESYMKQEGYCFEIKSYGF
jgi:hypothetical protein